MPNRPELKTEYDSSERVVSHKGAMRTVRANKRAEAEARNAKTDPKKRRAYRNPVLSVSEAMIAYGVPWLA